MVFKNARGRMEGEQSMGDMVGENWLYDKGFYFREVVKLLIPSLYISKGSCTHSYHTQKSGLEQFFLLKNYT